MDLNRAPESDADNDAHEAARFYAATFPDSEVTAVHEAPGDDPGGRKATC
jgi:predicted 3-demethylubiquinone-9 3-methyltransferase (glyoxalase superfamily)